MKEQTKNQHWLLCATVVLIALALYPSLTTAQGGAAPEDTSATGTTVYATTSIGELLPVPIEATSSSPAVLAPDQLTTSIPDRPLTPVAQTRIINLAANISNRLDTALARLQNIHERMVRRAALLQAAGQDTRSASDALALSRTSLDLAAERLAPIDTLVYTATTAPTPKTAWVEVTQEYIAIANDLRTTKAQLVTTLTQLKNTSPVVSPSTASTTDNETVNP